MLLPALALLVSNCDPAAADLLYKERKFSEAADVYHSQSSRCPPSVELFSGLGRSLLAIGRAGEAVPYLARASSLRPDNRELRRTLAQALIDAGRLGDAEPVLEALRVSDPKDAEAQHLEGLLMYRNGYYQRALEFLEKSLALHADNVPGQTMRAVALLKTGRIAEGQAACKKLFDNSSAPPDIDLVLTYAESLYEDGRASEALPYATRAVQLWPRNSISWFWRARLLLELGRNEEALKDAQQSVQLAPQFPFGHSVLLETYRRLGRAADAIREVEWLRRDNDKAVSRGQR